MVPAGTSASWAWSDVDVAVPRKSRLPSGVSMAGFHLHAAASWDISMVAHPSVTLLIDLGESDRTVYDTGGRRERGSVVLGLLPGEFRAAGRGRVECLQVRLAPVAAATVLGSPAEFSGRVVALGDVWGRDATRAEERLRAATSWEERFAVAAQLLARRSSTRRTPDPEVAHAWRRMLAGRGRARVDGLAEEVGWSRKRLWARFRSQVGITPKRAARLVRFDHAAHLLAAGRAAAGVAAESGYADQPHLHRETMAFTGLTPAAVAAAPWLAIDDVAWPASR